MDGDDPDADGFLVQLLLILLLTAINAFLASAEIAMLSVNKIKISSLAEEGNKKAKAVIKLNNDQTRFLSTIQVGITFAGFFSSATAATYLSDDLGKIFISWGMSSNVAGEVAVIVVTLILSYFTLVFGELFPKRLALKKPEAIAMNAAPIIVGIRFIFAPFVKLLTLSTNGLVRLFGLNNESNEKISEDEIISVLETGVSDGTINSGEQKMIESIFRFDDLVATDIMTPRVNAFMIDVDDPPEEILTELLSEQYSRVPVYYDNRDNIIGIILLKEVLAVKSAGKPIEIRKLLRKAFFVYDNIAIDELFSRMQKSHNQMAILTDEFGGFSGIVTMEDLIEEIVGNIYDEYDDDTNEIVKQKDGSYIVPGATPIQDINRAMGSEFDEENEDYDTINGLVNVLLGRLPERVDKNRKLNFEQYEIEILAVEDKRVTKVRITMNEKDDSLKESTNDKEN